MEIVKPKTDVVFKRIFTDKDNADLLQDLLSAILDIPSEEIKNIEIKNVELPPEVIGNKFGKLDISLEFKNNLVNIEMQINKQLDFGDRSLFYWAKLYTSNLKAGDDYGQLQRSISINIVDFNIFGCEEFHSAFTMMEKNRHEILSDKCQIHFLELGKLSAEPKTKLEMWLKFIDAESEEELDMLTNIENIAIENTPIQKAIMYVKELSADEKLREIARLREKALHDEASALKTAKAEGIELGKAEGIELGKAEGKTEGIELVALNMLKQGTIPKEQIAVLTGLPLSRIEELY